MRHTKLNVSIQSVKAVICYRFKLKQYDIAHETLANLGIKQDEMFRVQNALREHFMVDVEVSVSDTIAAITDRLTNKTTAIL